MSTFGLIRYIFTKRYKISLESELTLIQRIKFVMVMLDWRERLKRI
jgi:hypothetical protein